MSRNGVVEKLTRGIDWDPTRTYLCTVKEEGQSGGVDVPSQGRSGSKSKTRRVLLPRAKVDAAGTGATAEEKRLGS